MSAIETLKELLGIYGPSGREEKVADAIEKMVKPHADEISRDAMGNLVAVKRGGGRKVMLAAHMDQIGLMVTHIDGNGFLRATQVGGVTPVWALFTHVRFENGTKGVIGYETKAEGYDKLKHEHLFIDIGARTREEAEARVQIGDMAVFDTPVTESGRHISSGAMDDRTGCAVLVEVLRRAKDSPYDLYAVFTTQEEVGTRGAHTAAYGIMPELGIALDITPSPDTPEATKVCSVEMGRGPAVKVRDNSLICHPRVRRWLEDAAKSRSIPFQYEVLTFGGTDAGAIQASREGIPSGVISIPTRYGHTTAETIDKEDLEQCVELLLAALAIEA
jgi:putative aminopeptidase FrvX